MNLYPFIFRPIFKERVWGGRRLADLYSKRLPAEVPIGESWEVSDRPGDSSVIANGPLAGKDLRWLMERHPADLFGSGRTLPSQFPLLIKILDSREKLSLQVHPPADKASALGGEPKTEMWFIADADPGAELYVGLKNGATRQEFKRKLRDGTVAECFHRVPVRPGDAMFLPSGRVHAIGSGLVIFEIQQNSDTTYRVFDWNRVGLDGKPRDLHIPQSLASIDFADFEPGLVEAQFARVGAARVKTLVKDPLFTVELCELGGNAQHAISNGRVQIIGLVTGRLRMVAQPEVLLSPGDFCLLPASLPGITLEANTPVSYLRIEPGA